MAKLDEALEELSKYSPGASGDHVAEMKRDLVRLGFVRWSNPTPHYGTNTARVVEDFQRYYNLPVTGNADKATRNKIKEVLNPPYRNGDRGEPVLELKKSLVKLGFARWSNPTQYYGTNTANVVKEFQRTYGLKATGVADEQTLAKIQEEIENLVRYVR